MLYFIYCSRNNGVIKEGSILRWMMCALERLVLKGSGHVKSRVCSLFAALNRSKSIYPSENAEETKIEETSFRIGAVCICLYSVQFFFFFFFLSSGYKLILPLD